jgi:hypothetical protein
MRTGGEGEMIINNGVSGTRRIIEGEVVGLLFSHREQISKSNREYINIIIEIL